MASSEREPAVFTVPADYLEDVRSAFAVEIEQDGDMLRENQKDAARRVPRLEWAANQSIAIYSELAVAS